MNTKLLKDAVIELSDGDHIGSIQADLETMFGCVVNSEAYFKLPPHMRADLWNSYNKLNKLLARIDRAAA